MEFNLENIKNLLLYRYPYFGTVIADMEYVIDYNHNITNSTLIDGKVIYISKDYMDNLSESQQIFVLAHEVCHIALNHIERSKNKDAEIWQIATDAVINAHLRADGLTPVDETIFIKNAELFDAEELYEKIYNNKKTILPKIRLSLFKKKKKKNQALGSTNKKSVLGSKNKTNDDNSFDLGHSSHSKWDNKTKQNTPNENTNQSNNNQQKGKEQQNIKNNDNIKNKNSDNTKNNDNKNNIDTKNNPNYNSQNNNNNNINRNSDKEDIKNKSQQQNNTDNDSNALNTDKKNNENNENNTSNKSQNSNQNNQQKISEKDVFNKNNQEKSKLANQAMQQMQSYAAGAMEAIEQEIKDVGNDKKPVLNWKRVLIRNLDLEDEKWGYKYSSKYNNYRTRIEDVEYDENAETEIILDTSGSVNIELLKSFLRQVKLILKDSTVKIGTFSSEFHGWQQIKKISDIDNLKLNVGGNTNFDSASKAFSKRREVNKICFTDGVDKGNANIENKRKDIVWISFINPNFKPDNGKVIYVTKESILDGETVHEY